MGEDALTEQVVTLTRRLVDLQEREVRAAVKAAMNGRLDPERFRWLIRCQKDIERLAGITRDQTQPSGHLDEFNRLLVELKGL